MSAIAWGVAGVILIGLFVFLGIRSARRRDAARAEAWRRELAARIARGQALDAWERLPDRTLDRLPQAAPSRSRASRARRSSEDRRASHSTDSGVRVPTLLDTGSDPWRHSAAWGSTGGGGDDASARGGGFETGGSHGSGGYTTGGGFGGDSHSSSSSSDSSSSSSCGSSDSGSSGCGGGGD